MTRATRTALAGTTKQASTHLALLRLLADMDRLIERLEAIAEDLARYELARSA